MAGARFMSLITGEARCGALANCDSSTILGSIRISLTCSGVRVNRNDAMIALRHTDLPEPVAPATSRCGILARSTTMG